MANNTYYTSRSATECFDHCDRHRFLEYHFGGRGLTLKAVNFPLAVGTDVHVSIGTILQAVKDLGKERFAQGEGEQVIEQSIKDVLKKYDERIVKLGYFDQQGNLTQRELYFTYAEQKALLEALIRAWCWIELPRIMQRYEILDVEREYVQEILDQGTVNKIDLFKIAYQGTPDAILQDITTKDCVVYSLKTAKQFNERTEKGFSHDLQGITETWLVEEEMKERNRQIDKAAGALFLANLPGTEEAIKWIRSKQWPTSITGQQMCVLVKGARRKKKDDSYSFDGASEDVEDKPAELYTASPLIRGYRKHTPEGTIYAHSYFFPNPANKSGKGALGKSWEPFNVWEDEQIGGVKGWIQLLAAQKIQPECGDILRQQVITPPEYFRSGMDLEGTIEETLSKERHVVRSLKAVEEQTGCQIVDIKSLTDPNIASALQEHFPRVRRGCHYPTDCAFLHVCFNRKVAADPLNHQQEGVPQYEIRMPHHETELKALEGK